MLDALPVAFYATDADGRLTFYNDAAADFWGHRPVIGRDMWCGSWKLFLPDGTPLPHDQCPMAIALKERRPVRGAEAVAERPDGTQIPFIPYPTPLFDKAGEMVGALNMLVDITSRKGAEIELRRRKDILEMLNRIARNLSSDLDLERIVQAATDGATELSGAQFGAFFYNVVDQKGERYQLYTLSGASPAAFQNFGMPRNTAIFEPTFRGESVVRSDDIRKDPRYGLSGPHCGLPKGHLPVVSYLAVPVVSRSGEVHGGLFFGHSQPGIFTAETEEIVSAIAAHAATAIDNARLLEAARREVEQRRTAERVLARRAAEQEALYRLTDRLQRAESEQEVFDAALEAIQRALGCERASILLFDPQNVMRFAAWRGLSDAYRQAVDGHSPWTPETGDPEPISVSDVAASDLEPSLRKRVLEERIAALAFVPVMADGSVIGKFMTYYDTPHDFEPQEIELALTIARQMGFGLSRLRAQEARRRAEAELRRNEERERARASELQAIMEAVPAAIWLAHDPDCRRITGNLMSQEILRLPPDANPSLSAPEGERPTSFSVLVNGRELAAHELPVQRAARGEEIVNFEEEVRFDDGVSTFLVGNARPLRDELGNPNGAVAAFVDITARRQAELASRESERRLQLAMEAGRMGAWEWDLKAGIVTWSPGLEAIHGLAPGTFEGTFEAFKRDMHPEDADRVLAGIRQAAETRSDYHMQYRIILPDGRLRWVEAYGRFAPDATGDEPTRLAGVCMDVTERKLAEEQRNLLVAELNHRVKNTLATVMSIARQSFAKAPSLEAARSAFEARIQALAQTHGRLAEASWSGVSLETVLLDELAPYRRADGANLRLDGGEVVLSPKSALTLGLAVHELATNAAKYGAFSTRDGVVGVSWRLEAPGRLRLQWVESGGPEVSKPERSGFGRLLLERALVSDLKGTVDLDFAKAGLRCLIAIPLDGHTAALPAS